jgi:hypothetical protein
MSMRYPHNVIKMVFGFLGAALVAAALLGGCGQKDPTSPPTGAIFVSSSIPGAAIFLNGFSSGDPGHPEKRRRWVACGHGSDGGVYQLA